VCYVRVLCTLEPLSLRPLLSLATSCMPSDSIRPGPLRRPSYLLIPKVKDVVSAPGVFARCSIKALHFLSATIRHAFG